MKMHAVGWVQQKWDFGKMGQKVNFFFLKYIEYYITHQVSLFYSVQMS